MRVAMLARGWHGYLDAGFGALADRGVDLLVIHPLNEGYTEHRVGEYAQTHVWTAEPQSAALGRLVNDFGPDAVLMHSWDFSPYRSVMRGLPDGTLRVLYMDNVWRNTARQWAGRAVSRYWVHPLFDAAMVPSDRTEFFARRLGFAPHNVIRGSLSADTSLFHTDPRPGDGIAEHHRFVAVLRLVNHKGADVLAEAYRCYRELAEDPWELSVAGVGPMESEFRDLNGVQMHGFMQPSEIADLMRRSSAFINPSREEPYAVVLHEAASCGLPLLCTDFVGAAPTMIQDGYNGWVVTGGRADLLADAMLRMSTASPERLAEMSLISRNLSTRLSSTGWARNLHEELERRLATSH